MAAIQKWSEYALQAFKQGQIYNALRGFEGILIRTIRNENIPSFNATFSQIKETFLQNNYNREFSQLLIAAWKEYERHRFENKTFDAFITEVKGIFRENYPVEILKPLFEIIDLKDFDNDGAKKFVVEVGTEIVQNMNLSQKELPNDLILVIESLIALWYYLKEPRLYNDLIKKLLIEWKWKESTAKENLTLITEVAAILIENEDYEEAKELLNTIRKRINALNITDKLFRDVYEITRNLYQACKVQDEELFYKIRTDYASVIQLKKIMFLVFQQCEKKYFQKSGGLFPLF